ncbi:MAG: hypothetical protein KJ077_51795, partial [Anaerolineae bacterium]|nr:hypothetical protein [Anaerolineae bacterium]
MKAFGNYFIGLARPGMNARAMEQRRVNPALARLIGRCWIVRRLYRRTSAGGKVAAGVSERAHIITRVTFEGSLLRCASLLMTSGSFFMTQPPEQLFPPALHGRAAGLGQLLQQRDDLRAKMVVLP